MSVAVAQAPATLPVIPPPQPKANGATAPALEPIKIGSLTCKPLHPTFCAECVIFFLLLLLLSNAIGTSLAGSKESISQSRFLLNRSKILSKQRIGRSRCQESSQLKNANSVIALVSPYTATLDSMI